MTALILKYEKNKASVGSGVGIATLRGDLSSREKSGRKVEATLMTEVHFSDGFVLAKGTVL